LSKRKDLSIKEKKINYFDKLEKCSQREAAFIMNNSTTYIKPNFKNRKRIDKNGEKLVSPALPKQKKKISYYEYMVLVLD